SKDECLVHACGTKSVPPLQVDPRKPSGASRTTTIADRPGFVTSELKRLEGSAVAREATEDSEGVLRRRLPGELPARLDLAVQAPGQLLGLLAGRGAGDHVGPAPNDPVAVGLEPQRELLRLAVGAARDPHLPGRVAVLDRLLLDRLGGRLVVPALLRLEPMLLAGRPGLVAHLGEVRPARGHRA